MHTLRSLPLARSRFWAALFVIACASAIGVPYARADPGAGSTAVAAPTGHTFSSSFDGGTTVKVTAQGNVAEFISAANQFHQNGHFTEPRDGYILCSNTTRAFDFGTGSFGPATFGSPTATFANKVLTVIRTTKDNRLRLTQNFSFDGVTKRLRVKMTVKNLSSTPAFNVALRRQADFDVDSAGTDPFAGGNNRWLRDTGTVVGWDDQQGHFLEAAHGMMLINQSPDLFAFSGVSSPDFDVTTCGLTNLVATPFVTPGDESASLAFRFFTLEAGQSRTAIVDYQRI
jgi:hypothetical protein